MAASVKPSVVCAPPGPHGECFSTKFHHDMSMLAAGYADGSVLVYDPNAPPAGDGAAAAQGKLMYTIDPKSTLPTTTVRFRPQKAASKTRNVLVSCGANGVVQHWHITSGKCIHVIEEEDDEMVINKDGNTSTMRHYKNQIFTMEYNNDGSRFATAGKDYKVRLYDEATKSIISTLSRGIGKQTPGHSNRVFSVKFHPLDENMVLSAGWDNTVQIWDLRVEGAVRNIFGPHICGDSMDIDCDGGEILTGSWRPEEQLQLWDFGAPLPSHHPVPAVPRLPPRAECAKAAADAVLFAVGCRVGLADPDAGVAGELSHQGALPGLRRSILPRRPGHRRRRLRRQRGPNLRPQNRRAHAQDGRPLLWRVLAGLGADVRQAGGGAERWLVQHHRPRHD